jgi:thiol:disulfide interchange protein
MSAKPYLALAAVLFATAACGNASSTASSSPPSSVAAAVSQPASHTPEPPKAQTPEPLPNGYDPSRNAEADIAAALEKAKADKRPVLLDFGADWCPDCVVLGRTFRTDTVRPVIDRYHVVSVDVGKFNRHVTLAKKYGLNLQTSGIPALVVLSDSGKVRTTTNDGSFADARTMTPDQVAAFLNRWQ